MFKKLNHTQKKLSLIKSLTNKHFKQFTLRLDKDNKTSLTKKKQLQSKF